MTDTFPTSADYAAWLAEIKTRIRAARISAARAVNRDLILLYWDIGREIVENQYALDWGDAVVNQLASDLRKSFPPVRGFSKQNVWRMRQLYLTYTSAEFLSQAVRVCSISREWSQHVVFQVDCDTILGGPHALEQDHSQGL